jgi:ATP-dependent Clp protease ATP-binding subunit ClpA
MYAFFAEQIIGQEQTLRELCRRLGAEALGRPLHQPLRLCCQGTPGTGKSASAALLARRLEVPFVNIDAAGVTDPHSAGAMLLGSGRGIVMSHQPGKLEQAAKHHSGCVLEISDLDHAPPTVCGYMADIFLQLLETGEAQSATGGVFPCSNLILVFTFNLPDGMDERLRRGIGFGGAPARSDLAPLVRKELLRIFSPAFFSRMGAPIIFDPLDGLALAAIIERELRGVLTAGCARLHLEVEEIILADGIGTQVVEFLDADLLNGGARVLIAQARALATQALLTLRTPVKGGRLVVSASPDGTIILQPQRV